MHYVIIVYIRNSSMCNLIVFCVEPYKAKIKVSARMNSLLKTLGIYPPLGSFNLFSGLSYFCLYDWALLSLLAVNQGWWGGWLGNQSLLSEFALILSLAVQVATHLAIVRWLPLMLHISEFCNFSLVPAKGNTALCSFYLF